MEFKQLFETYLVLMSIFPKLLDGWVRNISFTKFHEFGLHIYLN